MTHRTLLLSPWYVPLQILRWEDAVKMRYEGTAEVVAEYQEKISSPSLTWRVPAVIRLHRLPSRSMRGVKFSRVNVYQRDGYRCQYCGHGFPLTQLSYDHVVPRAAGGKTNWSNIVTACRSCNGRKSSRTCDESGMFPLSLPRAPKFLPVRGPRIDPALAPLEWHAFLTA